MRLIDKDGKTIINFNAPLWRALNGITRFIIGVLAILAIFYASCEPIWWKRKIRRWKEEQRKKVPGLPKLKDLK